MISPNSENTMAQTSRSFAILLATVGLGSVLGPVCRAAQNAPADVPSEERHAGGVAQMRYFLIGPQPAAAAPEKGRMLVLVLPGGNGGEGFRPFVERIWQHALPPDALVAQLVAVRWTPTQRIIWPTLQSRVPQMTFSTEQFVEAVVRDVASKHRLDPRRVFTLSWSSGGPAAYAVSLLPKGSVAGSLIAMSVFKPRQLPPLRNARGHAYCLLHSPQDEVCPFRMATEARDALKAAGAAVRFVSYEGGHGWHGDCFGMIRTGIAWLEEQTAGKPGK
jgi:predicted esterase